MRRLLVANRSEIAIRVFRAASEMGIRTIAVYAEQDKLSPHRFKADEAYQIGKGMGAVEAYLSIDEIVRVAKERNVDAIHPGYGFLSESPEFAEACASAGRVFIGPFPETMRVLGNKVRAREVAVSCGVSVMPASGPLPSECDRIADIASRIGYPLMLKASWGGGGRGMRPIESEGELIEAVAIARREAKNAFGKDEVYLEKLVRRARHVEVQILGDRHGNLVHLFERDCSIQRRHQKLIERAPAPYLTEDVRATLCDAALKIGRAVGYVGAGTVEFLIDSDTGDSHFIEVNPRIQVEHTVTEVVTGLDIVKAQIKVMQGGRLGHENETGIPKQNAIEISGHAIQCRITAEDPENNFSPDHGKITAYRCATGFGIRVDGGSAYPGALVATHYDPMLEKVTAWAPTAEEAVARMSRALNEYRIRGIATNLRFLHNVVSHPRFNSADYTTRFIDQTPELFEFAESRDRATKLLAWIAEVTINGHPETRDRKRPPAELEPPNPPEFAREVRPGSRQLLDRLGARKFSEWMRAQRRLLVTDTTMRDAHQSLLATRVRTHDIAAIASSYAVALPELLSLECWGGATFDAAMRFLAEDPWQRLARIRERVPNILTQMLLRGANAVGYANYPDNVVRHFVRRAADSGIDIFRVFDCLNWVENMRVAIDAAGETGKLVEGTICYTGDFLHRPQSKYSLDYYLKLARELASTGVHILCVKDMAGILKPDAARVLFGALRKEIGLPIHFHTHDTSGIAAATVLAAVESEVDAIDAAIDSMSGSTSQPCLGSIVEALVYSERDTGLDRGALRKISSYWETARRQYAAFENEINAGASEVYLHEMPGGQLTNLKQQARSLGLESRWHEIAYAYREANNLFGDIVKVTPSSKVVGDMALMMVSQGLTTKRVLDPAEDIAFPASVVEMLRGDLGQPYGGWPAALQAKVLKATKPILVRPGSLIEDADLEQERVEAERRCGRQLDENEFTAYLMYPKLFCELNATRRKYGPVDALPTSTFFYGMRPGKETIIEIEGGKVLIVRLVTIGAPRPDGMTEVFFELNGHPRVVEVSNRLEASAANHRLKAEKGNDLHVAAPMPGLVTSVRVKPGQTINVGDILMTLEAMKMETILHAPRSGTIANVLVAPAAQIEARDLLVELAC